MPEWLQRTFPNSPTVAINDMVIRLLAAFILGCGVAAVYRFTHRKDAQYSPTFVTTLVMLAVLIAVATQVIGGNGARAFTLLGALAIIRFRTVMQDSRDTAFVIFSVIEGMAAGDGHLEVALAGFVIAAATAAIFRPRSNGGVSAVGVKGAGRYRRRRP